MKKKLLALFVILLAGSLSGCELRGFIDRIRFNADLAGFIADHGDHESYTMHLSTVTDVAYWHDGVKTTNSVTVTVDNKVDLGDFYVDAEMTAGDMTQRYFIYRENDAKTAYQLHANNRLVKIELTEGDLSLLCGCVDDAAATGIADFDHVVRNADGTYSQSDDLGDESGLGYNLSMELATSLGIDRAELAGTMVTATIELDREAGTIRSHIVLENLSVTQQEIEIEIDVDSVMEWTFVASVERIDMTAYFFPLPEQIAEIVDTIGPNEPVSGYIAAFHHVGWIRIEVTAGAYDIVLTNTNSTNPYSLGVCNAQGTLISSAVVSSFTFPADGVYLLRIESSTTSPQFTITLVPKP
ncbi:MAG TPA: hypothetical protein DCR44_00355 [Acholeplasmatales bacterium]|nr:MAG: hypothetical protein A2Y16_04810 [Tenericutes bacterium GWF2_57_13]HAQ55853.1 hypothetical protein [Acholeplasmatales bacterium]